MVGTNADAAILRVHEQDPRPPWPTSPRHPRAADHRPRHQRRRRRHPDPVAQAGAAGALERQRPVCRSAEQLQHELVKVDNVGLTYIVGGKPRRRSASSPTPRSWRCTASRCSSWSTRCATPTARSSPAACATAGTDAHGGRRPDAGRRARYRPAAAHHAATAARSMCKRRRLASSSAPSPPEHRAWTGEAGTADTGARVPAVSLAFAKRAGANAVVVAQDMLARLQGVEGRLVPADVDVTVTRDYGETANDKANELLFHLGLATVSIVVLIAFAIGWREARGHARRDPDHHPADPVRLQADGLHHQPRQPVRPDLFHRHPGRRRHRRGREHRPPLGDEGRPRPR